MSRTRSRIGWSLLALTCALDTGAVALSLGHEPANETVLYPLVDILMAGAGALIVARHPQHRVGWLLCASGVFGASLELADGYGLHDFDGSTWGAWYATWAWIPHGVLLALILVLFPDGRFLSSRWRPAAWTTLAGCLIAVPGVALGSMGADAFAPAASPVAIDAGLASALAGIGQALFVAGFVLSGASLVVRLRRSHGVERQQLKWFAYAVALLIAVVPFVVGLWYRTEVVHALFPVALAGLPVGAYVGIMRHRLYDIDRVINRTLVYGALTASIVGVYAAVLLAVEALLHDSGSGVGAVVATGAVAVAVQPLRTSLQQRVNRVMYGDRSEPYAALSRLGQRLGADVAPGAVLNTIVAAVAEALRVPHVAIELGHGTTPEPAAEHGKRGHGELERVPLVSRGETVGRLVVETRTPGDPLRADERRLLEDLARQAAPAVDAVRLTNDLQRSRERLVVALEEERRRLRRDLHDGLGPALAGVVLSLDNARELLRKDPDAASALLGLLREATQEAIGDVRRLVYGLRPPTLDELGLVPAIREQAARLNGNERGVRISVDGPDGLADLPAAVEVAAYRIAAEAITNVVRHSDARTCRVSIELNGALELDIRDDGHGPTEGYEPGVGINSMRERATELGGSFSIDHEGDRGTRVQVVLPLSGP